MKMRPKKHNRRPLEKPLPEFKSLVGGKLTGAKRAYFRFVWPYVGGALFNAIGRYAKIRKIADLKPGQRVVEISSGAIPFYRAFLKSIGKEGLLVASDYHLDVLRDARRIDHAVSRAERAMGLIGKTARHVAFDSRKLPFKDSSVDRIVASYVYRLNIPDVVRTLKPGGKAIIMSMSIMARRHAQAIEAYEKEHGGILVTHGSFFHIQFPDPRTPFRIHWTVIEKK